MKSPKDWYVVKRLARKLGVDLVKQDSSAFFPSSFKRSQHKTLSFCITHKNRVSHIQKTLAKNLEDNRTDAKEIEFVLVDFDENEKLASWVAENFASEIESGYLKYFKAPLKKWSSPIAKNTSHRMGGGVLLTNLDCDNYTGKRGGAFVIKAYEQEINEMMFWQFSRVRRDGSFGRITLTRDMFYKMGGYDESLGEMGFQDNDLMNRAMALGVKRTEVNTRKYNRAIKHAKYKPVQGTFKTLNHENAARSKKNLAEGKLIANAGKLGVQEGIKRMQPDGSFTALNSVEIS